MFFNMDGDWPPLTPTPPPVSPAQQGMKKATLEQRRSDCFAQQDKQRAKRSFNNDLDSNFYVIKSLKFCIDLEKKIFENQKQLKKEQIKDEQ